MYPLCIDYSNHALWRGTQMSLLTITSFYYYWKNHCTGFDLPINVTNVSEGLFCCSVSRQVICEYKHNKWKAVWATDTYSWFIKIQPVNAPFRFFVSSKVYFCFREMERKFITSLLMLLHISGLFVTYCFLK